MSGFMARGPGVWVALLLVAFLAPASGEESLPAGSSPKNAARSSSPAGPHVVATKPPNGASLTFKAAYLLATVPLRSGPGANYDLVQVVPQGDLVGVARCAGGWCAVVWKGRHGFASADVLNVVEPGPDGTYPVYDEALTTAYHGGAGEANWPPNFSWAAFVGLGYGPHSHYPP
jgi:Bacterial SH3 domain